MGEAIDGCIYVRFAQWDEAHRVQEVHWRWMTPAYIAALAAQGGRQDVYCVCCLPEVGRWLAEVYDGTLVLRGRRHGRPHFVTLSPQKILEVLAAAAAEAYALPLERQRPGYALER